MAVHGPELVGRRFSSQRRCVASAQSIRTFAEAIGADSRFTPPTFLISFSVAAAEEFLPALGFDWARVVHGDQRFLHHRDIQPGEELSYSSEIESYKNLAGNEFVSIRTDFFSVENSELVSATWSTLVFRGEQS
jgi:hypothetical protein